MTNLRTAAGCLLLSSALALARIGSLVQSAPVTAAAVRNPLEGDEQAQRAGAKLYARECAACHGASRDGRGNAPPLNQPEVYRASSGTLFWVLRNGSLRRGMPSFAHLPEAQRWQIIAFLQNRASH